MLSDQKGILAMFSALDALDAAMNQATPVNDNGVTQLLEQVRVCFAQATPAVFQALDQTVIDRILESGKSDMAAALDKVTAMTEKMSAENARLQALAKDNPEGFQRDFLQKCGRPELTVACRRGGA